MLTILPNGKVSGLEIHKVIESKNKRFDIWVKRVIEYADLEFNKDFSTKLYESTGGRPFTDYEFTVDAAKEICLLERNEKGKEIRRWLISLGNKVESGLVHSNEQIKLYLELIPIMGLTSVQKKVEKDHYNFHNNKWDWWDYRAKLIGYGTDQLKSAVEKLNKKYKSWRKALVQIDKYDIIRIGIMDLLISLGKSEEYAKNTANICKDMAISMKVNIWDDSPEKNSIPFNLGINKQLESSIKNDQLKLK